MVDLQQLQVGQRAAAAGVAQMLHQQVDGRLVLPEHDEELGLLLEVDQLVDRYVARRRSRARARRRQGLGAHRGRVGAAVRQPDAAATARSAPSTSRSAVAGGQAAAPRARAAGAAAPGKWISDVTKGMGEVGGRLGVGSAWPPARVGGDIASIQPLLPLAPHIRQPPRQPRCQRREQRHQGRQRHHPAAGAVGPRQLLAQLRRLLAAGLRFVAQAFHGAFERGDACGRGRCGGRRRPRGTGRLRPRPPAPVRRPRPRRWARARRLRASAARADPPPPRDARAGASSPGAAVGGARLDAALRLRRGGRSSRRRGGPRCAARRAGPRRSRPHRRIAAGPRRRCRAPAGAVSADADTGGAAATMSTLTGARA